uniref:Uncharacterized protein n=1 Tax=Candidatus Kentrum sp. SD TaxID=2126332 RepID=A0A450Z5K9_9GAMM|nr:MAG: hypothetical protein BECKSD772F_GA0070984_11509 [Candidatus Kentron sp. SD]VFK49052.1 MAG: hypothetical protein BECKSD772E_GA0070983_11559 [Candidatus Kentron sp. SD]
MGTISGVITTLIGVAGIAGTFGAAFWLNKKFLNIERSPPPKC